MKKYLSLIAASLCLLTSCGAADESSKADAEPITAQTTTTASEAVSKAEAETVSSSPDSSEKSDDSVPGVACAFVDRMYIDYDQLIEEADIIMIGEYLEDGDPVVFYRDTANKKQPYEQYTKNTLKAVEVFKGGDKISKDGTVDIFECYARHVTKEGKEQILAGDELAPRDKGDRMIFILKYYEELKRYAPYYGSEGRFPLPEDLGKTDKYGYKNGIIDGYDFQSGIYSRLISDYNIK